MHTAWVLATSMRLLQVGAADVYWKVYNDMECLVLLHGSRSWSGPDHLLPWSDGALLFGNAQSYSSGLHLKGAPVLSDFSPLETPTVARRRITIQLEKDAG